jgi:hypothetical protein
MQSFSLARVRTRSQRKVRYCAKTQLNFKNVAKGYILPTNMRPPPTRPGVQPTNNAKWAQAYVQYCQPWTFSEEDLVKVVSSRGAIS